MFFKIYKTLLFIISNLIFLFPGVALNLIFLAADLRSRAKMQAVLTMLWSRAMCRILGIRVGKGGLPPDRGGFTVCNHASYIDVFAMGSIGPTVFLSNHEVKDWPLIGWLARLGGTVFVNRNSKRAALDAMREIERKIDLGITAIIFPEGTTSDGKSVRAFKSAFFNIPARQKIDVRPVSIRYAGNIVDGVAWYGGMKLWPHYWSIAGLRRIDVSVHFGPAISPQSDGMPTVEARKRLCTLTHESIMAGFEALKQG
jgi:1-acyl-sn-glycerol-3-phosphate acyltransferase